MLTGLRQFFTMQPAPVPLHEERAFVTGPAVVEPAQTYFGIGNETYQPGSYVDYPATSNGVYACINVRSRTLASLPLKVYRMDAAGNKAEITNGPLWLLLKKVNPYWTLSRLLDMTEQSLGVWGECFWFLTLKGNQPAEIWWARADQVKVHPHPTEYVSHFTYDTGRGTPIRFERNETFWLRYANVADQYSGLSPLAAARLAADTASAAMHSNHAIFRNGSQIAGIVFPTNGGTFSKDQAVEVSDGLTRKLKGLENAHKLAVLRTPIDIKSVTLSPKDAEFLGAMNWALEDIARAYSVPIDKIGGKRTYQNVEESEKVFWHDCMLPEARFIAAELTEQLLPAFGENLIAEFDTSDVDVLHEAETERWTRIKEQITTGYDSINSIRKDEGLDPVPWGDVWWASSALIPINSNEKPVGEIPPALAAGAGIADEEDDTEDELPEGETPKALDAGRSFVGSNSRMIAYGSDEHQRLWNEFVDESEPWERKVAAESKRLMSAQRDSVLAQVRNERRKRDIADYADDPFDKPRWIKQFREGMLPVLEDIGAKAAAKAIADVTISTAFNVVDPNISSAIRRQSQKFAEEVNDTTWRMLRDTLRDGIEAGDDVDTLAGRVESVMADRIRSSATAIARTETARASSTGTHAGWKASGVVSHVSWLAALDERTRASHVEAHGQTVELGKDFHVGGCSGPGPGNLDCAREVVNCRCTTIAVLDIEAGSAIGA